jgi:hypothetical protein
MYPRSSRAPDKPGREDQRSTRYRHAPAQPGGSGATATPDGSVNLQWNATPVGTAPVTISVTIQSGP